MLCHVCGGETERAFEWSHRYLGNDGNPKKIVFSRVPLCGKCRAAKQHATPKDVFDMIAEWKRGCSCADAQHPEECQECTRALIECIEKRLRNPLQPAESPLCACQK